MMIEPTNWSDKLMLDSAIPRTPMERLSRLLDTWGAMQKPYEDVFEPAPIVEFLKSEDSWTGGFWESVEKLTDETNGIAWSHELEDSLISAMNDDAPDGYIVFLSDDGHVLYLSEHEAAKEGHIEESG